MWGETLVFFVLVGAAVCFAVLGACVMTLASIVVGDPDPLAWAKETGRMFRDVRDAGDEED
jgi:hypothetical protein